MKFDLDNCYRCMCSDIAQYLILKKLRGNPASGADLEISEGGFKVDCKGADSAMLDKPCRYHEADRRAVLAVTVGHRTNSGQSCYVSGQICYLSGHK